MLPLVLEYSLEHGLTSQISQKLPKRERKERVGSARKKGDTYTESLRLIKEGKTIPEIAGVRKISISTVESHLTRFVVTGEITLGEILDGDKRLRIEAALRSFSGSTIKPLKEQLGDDISYGQIRWVMAAMGIGIEKIQNI